jgi:multidrug efflux system outer membrane protein
MNKAILYLVVVMLLAGCAIGPDYKRPEVSSPTEWRFGEKEAKDVANTAWWHQFNDPVLNELINIALKENKDVKIAAARVEQFIGRYGTTRAALFPQVGAGGVAGRSRATEMGPSPITSAVANPADNYQAFLNGSWEIDLWGKLRRSNEAARANLLATEEGRRAVIMTLVTSVSAAYVNLRDLDKQLQIAKQTTKSREDSYNLFSLRFKGGIISELELNQVKSEYEQALATIPQLEKAIAQQENAISVLLGRNPGAIPRGKTLDELTLPFVPEGLPSDLLERRPDIRLAEQNLIAANAQIGVARALYFPTISLTGLFGWSSKDLSELFTGPAKAWSYAGNITVPIFTAGAIAGQVKAAEAFREQALITYQQSIQAAFRDVDDSLVDQKRTREQLDALKRQVDSLREYARIARLRYENGYTSYIEVLDAERSLFNAELQYVQTQGVLFQALVNLYKAMGGGWVVEADMKTGVAKSGKDITSEAVFFP